MDGIILIDKPRGWTSHDVVAKIRGLIKRQTDQTKPKVGHAGTLDPLASGLLVVLVGSYCKRALEFSKLDKVYEVEITLGQTSTTDDGEGDKTIISYAQPSYKLVKDTLLSFVGKIEQLPPIYSAIKVNGKRAYQEARKGNKIELKARSITVYKLTNITYLYPLLRFTVHVSSGTYIRSLARDIGIKLGTGAFMSDLRRTRIGDFDVRNASSMNDLYLQNEILQYHENVLSKQT